jgi:hypothetical protein
VKFKCGLLALLAGFSSILISAEAPPQGRKPAHIEELRFWLENMAVHHRFTMDEMQAATGLPRAEIERRIEEFGLRGSRPTRRREEGLLIVPYPGGRHPRIGFLDGAVDPQRETKVSVFTPWDPASYVVVDVPEAIWFQHGLLYLAHTHVPTIWSKRNITLEPLEWTRHDNGELSIERVLPNQVTFGARIRPFGTQALRMELWLRNGSSETLRDLRVQNCVMLKGAAGFDAQTNDNKVFSTPFAACRSEHGNRWIITAWEPCHRTWANPPCPCLHSDPKFPDCAPGETQSVRGWLSFYEGTEIEAELKRIGEQNDWGTRSQNDGAGQNDGGSK